MVQQFMITLNAVQILEAYTLFYSAFYLEAKLCQIPLFGVVRSYLLWKMIILTKYFVQHFESNNGFVAAAATTERKRRGVRESLLKINLLIIIRCI